MQTEPLAISLCRRAMVRLLTANDWFGDGQIREVILNEFNELRRTLEEQHYAVLDKPFNAVLTRLGDDEPMRRAVEYELGYMVKALKDAGRRIEKHNRP